MRSREEAKWEKRVVPPILRLFKAIYIICNPYTPYSREEVERAFQEMRTVLALGVNAE